MTTRAKLFGNKATPMPKKAIASMNESAFNGRDILSINNDDNIVKHRYFYSSDDKVKYSKTSTSKLRYNAKGRPYFNIRGQRYYIDEFMRTDYPK